MSLTSSIGAKGGVRYGGVAQTQTKLLRVGKNVQDARMDKSSLK
jgi:hypothetical protein